MTRDLRSQVQSLISSYDEADDSFQAVAVKRRIASRSLLLRRE
jgi:hypothetical protein